MRCARLFFVAAEAATHRAQDQENCAGADIFAFEVDSSKSQFFALVGGDAYSLTFSKANNKIEVINSRTARSVLFR
jgi:hypothetical protein